MILYITFFGIQTPRIGLFMSDLEKLLNNLNKQANVQQAEITREIASKPLKNQALSLNILYPKQPYFSWFLPPILQSFHLLKYSMQSCVKLKNLLYGANYDFLMNINTGTSCNNLR